MVADDLLRAWWEVHTVGFLKLNMMLIDSVPLIVNDGFTEEAMRSLLFL